MDIMKPVKVVSEFEAIIPDLSANEKMLDSSLHCSRNILRELRKFASALLGQMLLLLGRTTITCYDETHTLIWWLQWSQQKSLLGGML